MATLSRLLGDIDLAEDALQEAYVAALERWPRDGFPARTAAWIYTTARNAAFDRLRRERTGREKVERVASFERALAASPPIEPDEVSSVPDDRLEMMFACSHPALAVEARIALTLRTFAGLTTDEIADAFLVPRATMAQRLVRVKRKIREAVIPFAVPAPEQLPQRLDDISTVIYLIFNEGYASTGGDELLRRDLCDEAIRLCRVLLGLMPGEPEVLGLLALMLFAHSRRDARVSSDGSIVLLADQKRELWDRAHIAEACAILEAVGSDRAAGRYFLQARIAQLHATSETAARVDWEAIVGLYVLLEDVQPSPVVALNRVVAAGFAYGPAVALAQLNALAQRDLDGYSHFHLARADALKRLGRRAEAASAYETALALTENAAQRDHLRALIATVAEP